MNCRKWIQCARCHSHIHVVDLFENTLLPKTKTNIIHRVDSVPKAYVKKIPTMIIEDFTYANTTNIGCANNCKYRYYNCDHILGEWTHQLMDVSQLLLPWSIMTILYNNNRHYDKDHKPLQHYNQQEHHYYPHKLPHYNGPLVRPYNPLAHRLDQPRLKPQSDPSYTFHWEPPWMVPLVASIEMKQPEPPSNI